MTIDVRPAAAAEIHRWTMLELAPWQGFATNGAALARALRVEAEARMSLFLLHIVDGAVTLDDKSSGYAMAPGGDYGRALLYRAEQYRAFLAEVVRRGDLEGRHTIAVELEDLGRARFAVPVFSFQKRRGANTMLLPDVDFLLNDFFVEDRAGDPQPFDDKLDEAIFVGSTTGDPWLTVTHVREMRSARLRAATFFRDVPNVIFELPNIVQVDSHETRLLIEKLGVGGVLRSWSEQAARKFLISMDGNGATCSRVVRGLLGNNVLLKYNSPYLLYYFHGLEPWRHHIPIVEDRDVIDLLQQATANRALHRTVAARSRSFALDYLSPDGVMLYAAELLRGYFRITASP